MTISKYVKSRILPLKSVQINDVFWDERLKINSSSAIFYQWDKLEETHNQDNFRFLAGKKEGYRLSFFSVFLDIFHYSQRFNYQLFFHPVFEH